MWPGPPSPVRSLGSRQGAQGALESRVGRLASVLRTKWARAHVCSAWRAGLRNQDLLFARVTRPINHSAAAKAGGA